MKKRTISKLKSIFGSRKGKRQHQESSKSSRSPSPEAVKDAPTHHVETFRPIARTPPPTRTGPPPSPPVPTHPIAPVPPEPSGPLPLMPCPVCSRTFVPQSLAKHVKICEKMTIKKRKTFDSSRQRREGTDLEQYLPKNFGLPENSPFLEKSPPNTAKVTPKPKAPTVKSVVKGSKTHVSQPSADLQRCPHCNRAFGLRAFERHVEWCADKAKILPAAPAQPPPHIADAKQRLNARTQYKAPPVRNRRSSQSRDKSSHSRSASVDSSRGVSPPRDCGDYRRGRTRASESLSSNDHDEPSPHVPVIRNSRNSTNSSGDANVKARQARLARDLSSSRTSQDSTLQQSSTDPNLKKNANKPKNKISQRKQEQLKKLEEIANKYNERQQKRQEEKIKRGEEKNKRDEEKAKKEEEKAKTIREANKHKQEDNKALNVDKSLIPVTKKYKDRRNIQVKAKSDPKNTETDIPKPSTSKSKPGSVRITPQIDIENKSTVKKESKLVKESTMSLDSLEDTTIAIRNGNHQSVGINTELLCIPCIIHDSNEPKLSARKKSLTDTLIDDTVGEPKIELLYKNLTMVSSCDIQQRHFETEESRENLSTATLNTSITLISSEKSVPNNNNNDSESFHPSKCDDGEINTISSKEINKSSNSERIRELSTEEYDEDYEPDLSGEFEDSMEDKHNENDIARHGSGDTYTKFTENPDDLEEFINLTDKMISTHNFHDVVFDADKDLDAIHTPRTDSLETIHKEVPEDEYGNTEETKPIESDIFAELKNNLQNLLTGAGDSINEKLNNKNASEDEEKRTVSDMEHITVYHLKLYDKEQDTDKTVVESGADQMEVELKLPSITKNNKPEHKSVKKNIKKLYKANRKYKMLADRNRNDKEYQTFVKDQEDNSDGQSISADAPPLKLPRIDTKRLDDNYDPFASAARQMKELMSSDTNLSRSIQNSCKDSHRTLPILRPAKEKPSLSYLSATNPKVMKDSLNKTYQKTPTLQRMKSFGSANNENSNMTNTFGGRCSSFRLNRNDKQKSSQKLNTTFTKSSKENISVSEKNHFNRSSALNRSFSSYNSTAYSTPKPKEKIPKIATSLYHSFQRTTIKQPVKLDKIKVDKDKKDFVNLDSILADDNSSMTDSNYIDPRLINENDNLPINVNTILNNPDIISSMESLLTTENLPAKFESFSSNLKNNNILSNGTKDSLTRLDKMETNNNFNNKISAPVIVDDLSAQYDKIMSSLEQSIASKVSIRDDDSLCEDFDLEEFMTSFDEEVHKQKDPKRICSSTTRVLKQSGLIDSNRSSELNSISSSPKIVYSSNNGLMPINKSNSLHFSSNNMVSESLFPSSVKRSSSLLDSIQKKHVNADSAKSRQKVDQLEHDLMQSLKEFDDLYEDKNDGKQHTKSLNYSSSRNGTTKRESRMKSEKKKKSDPISNGNHTPMGKSTDSAYSSLNRISPSKLSICNSKESNGQSPLDQIAGSDSSGCQKDEIRSVSSEEFLAMERSAELDEPIQPPDVFTPSKEIENPLISDVRVSSRASWRREPSSSESEAAAAAAAGSTTAPRLSRFCHECGSKFPVDTAKFCIECGVRRLLV